MRPTQPPVHIFWDNSNMYVPAQHLGAMRDGPTFQPSVRLHFEHLYDLARAGRPVASAMCVGSVPPGFNAVSARIRALGVDVEMYERGAESHKEQGVDQCLQVHMLRRLWDSRDESGVAVLLTGDGQGYEDGVGFHADLERMQEGGWGIEVLSWERSCAQGLREWAETAGVFVPLDRFYPSITFVEGGRLAQPLSLRERRVARPVASHDGHTVLAA